MNFKLIYLIGCYSVCRNLRQLHYRSVSLLTDKCQTAAMCSVPVMPANMNCRNAVYPHSEVKRLSVPDDKVDWTVNWPDYCPPTFISPAAIGKPWADPEDRSVLG